MRRFKSGCGIPASTHMHDMKWYNHIKWWRPGELSVIFMVFHPRPPFNAVLPQQFLDSIVEFVK